VDVPVAVHINRRRVVVPHATTNRITAIVLAAALSVGVAANAQAQPNGPASGSDKADAAKPCKQGGWRLLATADGVPFPNQGQCVSYAVRGGTLVPWPSATPRERFRDICQSAGGTFSETSTNWRCDSASGLAQATLTELTEPCEEAERLTLWFPFVAPYTSIVCTDPPDLPDPPM
jgi:hypothetical protein